MTDVNVEPPEDVLWWPSFEYTLAIHKEMMLRDGQSPQHCDHTKLEGGLQRARWLQHYDGVTDPIILGAHLALSIARCPSFVDGNKRTAYVMLVVFLFQNQVELTVREGDITISRGIEQVVDVFQRSPSEGDAELRRLINYLRTVTVAR